MLSRIIKKNTNVAITKEELEHVLCDPIAAFNNNALQHCPEELREQLTEYVAFHCNGKCLQPESLEEEFEYNVRDLAHETTSTMAELISTVLELIQSDTLFSSDEDGNSVYIFDGFAIKKSTLEVFVYSMKEAGESFADKLKASLSLQYSGNLTYRSLTVKAFDKLQKEFINKQVLRVLKNKLLAYVGDVSVDPLTPQQLGDQSVPDTDPDPKKKEIVDLVMQHTAPENIEELCNPVWLASKSDTVRNLAAFATYFAYDRSQILELYFEMMISYDLPDTTQFSQAREEFMKQFHDLSHAHMSWTEILIQEMINCIPKRNQTLDDIRSKKNAYYSTKTTLKGAKEYYAEICTGFAQMVQLHSFGDYEDDNVQMFSEKDMNTIAIHPKNQRFEVGANFCPFVVMYLWAVLNTRLFAEEDLDNCLNELLPCVQSIVEQHHMGYDSEKEEFELDSSFFGGSSTGSKRSKNVDSDIVTLLLAPRITYSMRTNSVGWKGFDGCAFFHPILQEVFKASQISSPEVLKYFKCFKNPKVTDWSGDLISKDVFVLALREPKFLALTADVDVGMTIRECEWRTIWIAILVLARCSAIIGKLKPDVNKRRMRLWDDYVEKINSEVDDLQTRSDDNVWKSTMHQFYQGLLQYFSICMVQAENATGNRPGFLAPLYHPLMRDDLKPHILWEEMRQVYPSKDHDCKHCQEALLPNKSETDEEDDEEAEPPSDEEDDEEAETPSDEEDDEEAEPPSDEEDGRSDDDKVDNSEMLHRVRACVEDLIDGYDKILQFTTSGLDPKVIASCLLDMFKSGPHPLSIGNCTFSHDFLVEVAEQVVKDFDEDVAESASANTTNEDTDTGAEMSTAQIYSRNMQSADICPCPDLTIGCTCPGLHVSKYVQDLEAYNRGVVTCDGCETDFTNPDHEPTEVMDGFSNTKTVYMNLCNQCYEDWEKVGRLAIQNGKDQTCPNSKKTSLTTSQEEAFNAKGHDALVELVRTIVGDPSFASRQWKNLPVAKALSHLYSTGVNIASDLEKYVTSVMETDEWEDGFLKATQRGYEKILDWSKDPAQNEAQLKKVWESILEAHFKNANSIKEKEARTMCPWCTREPFIKTTLANLYAVDVNRNGKVLGMYETVVPECPQPCHESAEFAEDHFPHNDYMQTDPIKKDKIAKHTGKVLTIVTHHLDDYTSENGLDAVTKSLFETLETGYGKDLLQILRQIVKSELNNAREDCPDALLEKIPEAALIYMNTTFSLCGEYCMKEFKGCVDEVYETLTSDPIFASLAAVAETERQSSRTVAPVEEPRDPLLDRLTNAANRTQPEPMQVYVPEDRVTDAVNSTQSGPMQVDVPESRVSENSDEPKKKKSKKSKTQAQNFADQFRAMLSQLPSDEREAFQQGLALFQSQQAEQD